MDLPYHVTPTCTPSPPSEPCPAGLWDVQSSRVSGQCYIVSRSDVVSALVDTSDHEKDEGFSDICPSQGPQPIALQPRSLRAPVQQMYMCLHTPTWVHTAQSGCVSRSQDGPSGPSMRCPASRMGPAALTLLHPSTHLYLRRGKRPAPAQKVPNLSHSSPEERQMSFHRVMRVLCYSLPNILISLSPIRGITPLHPYIYLHPVK